MKAGQLWNAQVDSDKGAILLVAHAPQSVLVGASMPTGVMTGTKINSFAIFPQKGVAGVVMVCSNWNSGRQYEVYAYMLHVSWVGEKLVIDLEKEWIPSSDRIGGLAGYGIQLCIQGEWFSTGKRSEKGFRHLLDPNLACRYLIGTATAEEVIAAAEKEEEEVSALAQLREECSTLESRVSGYEARITQLSAELQELRRSQIE